MAFYNPYSVKIREFSMIVYLDLGIEKVLERKNSAIQHHIDALIDKNSLPKDTDYLIAILWADGSNLMTDIWIFTKTDAWGSGPLADVRIFQGNNPVNSIGIGSGNTLMVLGNEEELRRTSKSLRKYLSGPRPKLPDYLLLKEDFQK